MRVIFFILITSFTAIVSLPTHAAETFFCNNWLTDDQYKERTNPSGVEAVTTSTANLRPNKTVIENFPIPPDRLNVLPSCIEYLHISSNQI